MTKFDIYPIVERPYLKEEIKYDILPLPVKKKSEKIFINLENKITEKNIHIILTKKRKLNNILEE